MSYQLSDKNANFTIFKESVMSAKIAHFSELSNILGDNNSMCNIFLRLMGQFGIASSLSRLLSYFIMMIGSVIIDKKEKKERKKFFK